MKVTNHSTINNILFSIESEDMHIVFDKVSIQSITGNISFWIEGVFTGMVGISKAKEALKLMNELDIPELPKEEIQVIDQPKDKTIRQQFEEQRPFIEDCAREGMTMAQIAKRLDVTPMRLANAFKSLDLSINRLRSEGARL
jgi:YesN/AraC family two-component response regulator